MKPIEVLGREMCWAEFTLPAKKLGTTKARYWRELPDETRAGYIATATHLVAIAKNMKPVRLLQMIVEAS